MTDTPLLSVIIPVYNERKTIFELLKKVQSVDIDKEICIVDDCSSDGTRQALLDLEQENNPRIRILFHPHNMGKGSAIKTALDNVSGRIAVIQDADLELDPADYKGLIAPIINNDTKAVFGARKEKGLRYYGWTGIWFLVFGMGALKLIHYVKNLLYFKNGRHIKDVMSGYKMMPVEVMKSLDIKSHRFNIETEICAKLLKRGYHVEQVPVEYFPRTYKEGKKIGWRDVGSILYALLKYRFTD